MLQKQQKPSTMPTFANWRWRSLRLTLHTISAGVGGFDFSITGKTEFCTTAFPIAFADSVKINSPHYHNARPANSPSFSISLTVSQPTGEISR